MELYSFFTIAKTDNKNELQLALDELKEICVFCELVEKNGHYSIIGQIYGDDTNVGDLDLLVILGGIEHVWFDATCPSINNLNK